MRGPHRFELDHLPKSGSHLYVVEFSDGTVKLGRTSWPFMRIEKLASDSARKRGPSVSRCEAISARNESFAERVLLKRIREAGGVVVAGREFFGGVTYELAISIARDVAQKAA